MGLSTLIHSVGLFWLILHALRYLSTRYAPNQSGGILPAPSSSRRSRSSPFNFKVTLQHCYLRIETTQFNEVHDRVSLNFAKGTKTTLRRVLIIFYDVGSIIGLLGTLSALILLLVTVTRSASALISSPALPSVPQGAPSFSKRELYTSTTDMQHAEYASETPVHLIIPGVTVPLSHLPLLLVALFVTQVVHEIGHACSAALEGVPLLAAGASLTVLIPSAFVSLSSAAMQTLSPRARLRVISAGAFHNVAYWLFLSLIIRVGFGRFWWFLWGYEDVGHFGRVVTAIHEDSPLHGSLPLGSVVTSLDDLQLTSSDPSVDLWNRYLSDRAPYQDDGVGWCVGADWFMAQNGSCCTAMHTSADMVCFVGSNESTVQTQSAQRCVPALAVLLPENTQAKRCSLSADCGDHQLCVEPKDGTELVRIGLWVPIATATSGKDDYSDSKTVIWSGPREEILSEVTVGTYLPRYTWLPLQLPVILSTLTEYLLTLTLSLYLFNLLPLPLLDGSQLLEAFLDYTSQRQDSGSFRDVLDMEDLESGSGAQPSIKHHPEEWKQRIIKLVQITTGTLLMLCIVLGILYSLRH